MRNPGDRAAARSREYTTTSSIRMAIRCWHADGDSDTERWHGASLAHIFRGTNGGRSGSGVDQALRSGGNRPVAADYAGPIEWRSAFPLTQVQQA